MNYIDILHKQLPIDEGVRDKPYRDTVGKMTIGVGRNLDDVGLSKSEIYFLLDNDIAAAEESARSILDNFDSLSDARKAVVVNMAFNLGRSRMAGFTNTMQAIREGRWNDAADGMLSSKWAQQVGARAIRLAQSMRDDT
jgi:lysozyme